jgi:hypothetical protein
MGHGADRSHFVVRVRCIDLTCAVLVVASSDALSSAGRRVFGTLRDTRTVK